MSQAGSLTGGGGGGSNVLTLTGNSGGAVPPTLGNINVVGSGAISVAGNPGTSTLTISAAGSVATTYNEDSGSATPALGILNIVGDHGINTAGATNIVTIAIDNAITLGDLVPLGPNVDALTLATGDLTLSAGSISVPDSDALGNGSYDFNHVPYVRNYGTGNIFVGESAGNVTLTTVNATFNTGLGYHTLQSLTDGPANTAIGMSVLNACTTGSGNTGCGFQPLASLIGGSNNTAIGTVCMNSLSSGSSNVGLGSAISGLLTGSDNVAVGNNAGSAYNGAESNNVVINNDGVVGESNTLRIGATGSGLRQVNKCFIGGIDGVNVGSVATVVSTSGDQLGDTTITAGTNITVTPGANTITISSVVAPLINSYTPVNTSPYVVLSTDYYLGVDASGGTIQINLPNAPTNFRTFVIKDVTGSAASNNITVTTVGGVVLIDGATSFVMNTAYESVNLLFDGTGYQIY